jgi:hypothetical protein
MTYETFGPTISDIDTDPLHNSTFRCLGTLQAVKVPSMTLDSVSIRFRMGIRRTRHIKALANLGVAQRVLIHGLAEQGK